MQAFDPSPFSPHPRHLEKRRDWDEPSARAVGPTFIRRGKRREPASHRDTVFV